MDEGVRKRKAQRQKHKEAGIRWDSATASPATWNLKPSGAYICQGHWSLILHLCYLKGLVQVSLESEVSRLHNCKGLCLEEHRETNYALDASPNQGTPCQGSG